MLLLVDSRNRLIDARGLFRGTLSQTVVYPREVMKAALFANAVAVIFAHNHPIGAPDPSQADRMLTDAMRRALATIDVRVFDHIFVAGSKTTSFAEHGLSSGAHPPGPRGSRLRPSVCADVPSRDGDPASWIRATPFPPQRTVPTGCRSAPHRLPIRTAHAAP